MTINRLDHVSVVVEDLEAAVAFFVDLGMELEGAMDGLEGDWVDGVCGLEGVRVDMAMVRTPDGHGKIELSRFRAPAPIPTERKPPVNRTGFSNVMFAVDHLDEVLAGLRARGAEMVGEVVQYEEMYRLCYVRGPEGIIVALAEELR